MRTPNGLRILIALSFIYGVSCALVDTSSLEVQMFPATDNYVIVNPLDVPWIEFSDSIDRSMAESMITLKSSQGSILFDKRWTGNRLTLTPIERLKAGRKYYLSCKGMVLTESNRKFNFDRSVAFYYQTNEAAAQLLSYTPQSDAIVNQSANITLTFSKPMDFTSVLNAIMISPDIAFTAAHSEDNTMITITPKSEWKGLQRYQWTLSETARDLIGIPIFASYKGFFRTIVDTEPPTKPQLFSIKPSLIPLLKKPIEMMDKDSGICFEFAEPIDMESFRKAFRITPELHTTIVPMDDSSVMIYPTGVTWTPGSSYTFLIEPGITDLAGNITSQAFTYVIPPVIPVISIANIGNQPELSGMPSTIMGKDLTINGKTHAIAINTITTNKHVFEINVSKKITPLDAQSLISSITIDPLFPHYATTPTLSAAIFNQESGTITLSYTNFTVPTNASVNERVFYQLTIKHGPNGFTTEDGAYLLEKNSIVLETFKEH